MNKLVPRDYQQWGLDGVQAQLKQEAPPGMLLLYPTGTGKSPFPAWIFEWVVKNVYAGIRCCLLTHSKELVEQNYAKMMDIWPTAPAGIVSSGLGRRDISMPIIFAGIQTARNALKNAPPFHILIIDEAHRIPANKASDYRKFIDQQKARNPNLIVIGMTATNWINGKGPLEEVHSDLFQKVVIDACSFEAFNWFIDQGYLCDLRTQTTDLQYDLSEVTMSGDDYNQGKLQDAVDKDDLTRQAIAETLRRGGDRKHWMVFCAGINHTIRTAAILNAMGVPATFVHSDKKLMSEAERDRNIRDFKAGKYAAICNNGILTTGFDFPAVDMLVILRPTKSPVLWVQILGRGTRPFYMPGYDLSCAEGRLASIAASPKPWCLVLDFANNIMTCGPINDPLYKRKGKGGGVAPVRKCPECKTAQHTSIRFCKSCGYDYGVADLKIGDKAAKAEVRKRVQEDDSPKIMDFPVMFVTYAPHHKIGKPMGVRVTYFCGKQKFNEWLNFEEGSKLRGISNKRWRDISSEPAPLSTKDALERLPLQRPPKSIKVWLNHPSGYATITEYDYDTAPQP